MYYYLYKIVNKKTGSFYVGRRSCKVSPELDDYFGSGKVLKLAIKKYGKENFSKEILSVYETLEQLIQAEKEVVNEVLITRDDCYNIAIGGHGGFTYYKERVFAHTQETKSKISAANRGRERPDVRQRLSSEEDTTFKKYWVGKTRSQKDKENKRTTSLKNLNAGKHPSKIKLICPHCHCEADVGNAKRWHFEKCKRKNYELTESFELLARDQ